MHFHAFANILMCLQVFLQWFDGQDFHFLPWWDLVRELRAGQGPYSNISMPEIARERAK